MDRNDRVGAIAFGGLLLALVIIAIGSSWGPPLVDDPKDLGAWPRFLPGDTYAQWLGALLAAAGAAISIWAVIQVRRTLEANREATQAAVRAAQAAERSNEIARDIGERQVRAYLSTPEITMTDFVAGRRAKFRLKCRNTGQSPGRILKCALALRSCADPEGLKIVGLEAKSTGSVGANGYAHQEIVAGPLALSEQMLILTGTVKVVVAGLIIYEDVFGKTRRLTHRAVLDITSIENGGGTFTATRKNNRSN